MSRALEDARKRQATGRTENPLKRLMDIDVRYLYLVMVIAVSFPLLRPIGLPLVITKEVRTTFDRVNSMVDAGDIVLIDVDFDPSSAPELLPQLLAMGRHLLQKGAKIISFSMTPGGFMYQREFTENIAQKEYGYKYGEDIVSLPYKAGNEAAYAAFGKDMKALYTEDYYGRPLSSLPLWDKINTPKDAKLVICFCSGDQAVWLIRQVGQTTGVPVMNGTVSSSGAFMTPYWASGQLVGFVVGMSGAAEYELLSKNPGRAAGAMDGQSLGHILITLFVVLGNVGYYFDRKSRARKR